MLRAGGMRTSEKTYRLYSCRRCIQRVRICAPQIGYCLNRILLSDATEIISHDGSALPSHVKR